MVQSVKNSGLNVNHLNLRGHAALHYACLDSNSADLIRALLELPKINVNIKDRNGQCTPFRFACIDDPVRSRSTSASKGRISTKE